MSAGQESEQGELMTRLHQQALLVEIGRRALSDLDFGALLTEACRLTALGLETRYCKVLQYLPEENRLLVRAGVGWRPGVVGHATIGAGLDSPAGYALHTGKPVLSNHLSTEGRFRTPELLAEHGVQRAVNVILLGEGRPYGVLEADSENAGRFSEHDIDFLQGVANLLGVALEHRRAVEDLRALNDTLEERVEVAIAERRQAEDALRQAQKMEAVGQLTGGVAHDFNNLLLVIIGNLEMLSRAIAGDERLERLTATAQKAATRGAQITSQLLAFARRQTLQPEVRPVNDLIREFDVLALRLLGAAVEVEFQLDPAAGACHVDPAQFGSALLNLAVNARDAMPSGGQLVIRTGNVHLDARMASQHADARPGDYVMVEVADTGSGMSPEVLERATEPFFTTKEQGKGTGLGLSQVYGFMRQSDGFLSLASVVGEGTSVRLCFPQVAATAPRVAPAAELSGGTGTVLVVEDDADVRDLVIAQLEDLGYAVIASSSGPEALTVLDSDDGEGIDLLLTDMVMPGGMTGLELAEAVRTQHPKVRILLTSGYMVGEGKVPHDRSGGEIVLPILSKPYNQSDLARAIARALGRKQEGE